MNSTNKNMSKKAAKTTTLECRNCSVELPFNKAKVCGRCRAANYCSVECQAADWKKGHKNVCKIYVQPRDEPIGKDKVRCSVCLESLGDSLCTLPCTHTFHVQCSNDLREFGLTCPLCRAELPESPQKLNEVAGMEYLKVYRDHMRPNGTFRPLSVEQKGLNKDILRRMLEAAHQGHAISQFNLGLIYQQGLITAQDNLAAMAWFHKSALNGLTAAQRCVAQECVEKQDLAGAADWWLKAAQSDCAASQYNYGRACFYGDGIPVDIDAGFYWFQKSADGGCVKAKGMIIIKYIENKDFPKAIRVFDEIRPSLAADEIANTSYAIGEGYNCCDDSAKAFPYLMVAAKNGHARSQYLVSTCFSNGEGVVKDNAGALKWMRKAAEGGYATAQNEYAILLFDMGRHLEAFGWWTQSATQGYDCAQFNLSLAYKYGRGTKIDLTLAMKWCALSADQGHAPAEYNMGCHHSELREYATALNWFNKSAAHGYNDAYFNLGTHYHLGLCVEVDLVRAKKLYRMAAAKGNKFAAINLKALE
jgi:TPR repeat protein